VREELQPPVAGWYTDPSGVHEKRWWDGGAWTERVDGAQSANLDSEPSQTGHAGVEYRVEIMRQKLVGDHIGHDKLERMLNDRAAEGWLLKSIIKSDVQGRIAGGTEGLLIVFERQLL
jgi:hypothetical protein